MKIEQKTDVLYLPEIYHKREQKIAVLRYELAHPVNVSPYEMIDAMALSRADGTGRPIGHISDKTLYIALNYQEKADKLNASVREDIVGQLIEQEQIQDRLKYYVSLLDQRQADVIRLTYFKNCGQDETARKLGIVPPHDA